MGIKDPDDIAPATAGKGFIERILGFFMGMGDPEAERKKLLRAIGKDIANRPFKFYKPKGNEALPGLARFFHEIYKTVATAQVLMQNASSSGVLRSFVIDSFLSKDQRAFSERLTDAYILEKAKTLSVKDITELTKQDMIQFFSLFDADRTRQIDSAFNTLLAFSNFINFDFFFMLKKFDSNLRDRDFSYHPKFESISSDYISDDLSDFLEVFIPLNLEADWKRIFTALKEYRNVDVIHVESWLKLVASLKVVKQSQILELIVKHVHREPRFEVKPRIPSERIVEPFIDKLRNQTEILLQKLTQERKNAKIDDLAKAIFGTTVIVRMKYYTENSNLAFAKKMLGGYTYTAPINYLRAFLMDHFKKDIREQVDLTLVRGQWSTALSAQQLSDSYHSLLEVADAIVKFDEEIGDDGETGAKLRAVTAKSDRDKEAIKYLRQILKEINDKAIGLVNKAALNMIAIGRHYKTLIDDLSKPHHDILLNWKDIENASSRPIHEWLVEVYKKIYYMVQLLQFFIKGEE